MPNPTHPEKPRRRPPAQRAASRAGGTRGVVVYLDEWRAGSRAARGGGLSAEARMRHRAVLNMAAAAREARAAQGPVRNDIPPRSRFWRTCAAAIVALLGVGGMFGFVASYVGLASGKLDTPTYLALSLGSLLNYAAALLMVWVTHRSSSRRAAPR